MTTNTDPVTIPPNTADDRNELSPFDPKVFPVVKVAVVIISSVVGSVGTVGNKTGKNNLVCLI